MVLIKNWGANPFGRRVAQKLFNDRESKLLPAQCDGCNNVIKSINPYGFRRYKCGKEGNCEVNNIQHRNDKTDTFRE